MSLPNLQPQLESGNKKRRARGWLVPVLALTSLLRKVKAAGVSRRLEAKTSSNKSSWRTSFQIKNKKKKNRTIEEEEEEEYTNYIDEEEYYYSSDEEEGGGIWQRSILMGDKCNPLEFSGAIYYDAKGNKLEKMPRRTPRASLLLPMNSRGEEEEEGEFGDGGVWQKSILMGGKCQPFEFSGAIHYDDKGRKLDRMPPPRSRSPLLASPLHSFMSRPWIK